MGGFSGAVVHIFRVGRERMKNRAGENKKINRAGHEHMKTVPTKNKKINRAGHDPPLREKRS